MKHLSFAVITALSMLAFACASLPKPSLGKVADGFLVNVDSKGIILEGHDPVSLREGKDQAGSPSINTRHRNG